MSPILMAVVKREEREKRWAKGESLGEDGIWVIFFYG